MASEYYGLKGKLVKQYQDILRSLGANIKSTGKWGKKTEAAFNQYRDQFLQQIGLAEPEEENPYQSIDFTPRSEEELKSAAENRYGTQYDREIEALIRSGRDAQAALERQLSGVDPEHQGKAAALDTAYQAQRQTLSDAALSRGLGRSSYVIDQIAGNQKRQIADAGALAADAAARKRALEDSIAQSQGDVRQSAERLKSEREKNILSAIDEYRQADKTALDQATRYNNELSEKLRKEAEQKRQFEKELQHALELARMRKR